jgi:hypothetical protein
MANLPEIISNLDNGKGVYQGDAKFLMSDGSVIDKDGKEISPASALGAAAYSGFAGYMPADANIPAAQLPLATGAERGAVLAATKGEGDTVVCKIGSDGKLYVPTYPADTQYDMTAVMVEVDEVAAALPALPSEEADGYKLADQDTKKIYTLATVEETQTWGDGVALAAGKLYTDGTDIYVFGSGSLANI